MTVAARLTADQLIVTGAFTAVHELTELVADPDSAARPEFTGGYHGGVRAEWQARRGISGTVDARPVRVTDAQLVGWARALPPWARAGGRDAHVRSIEIFTQPGCATPPGFTAAANLCNPATDRVLHVCTAPAIYLDDPASNLIAAVRDSMFDFPYPCRWCIRVGFRPAVAGLPKVDALAAQLDQLGALVSDDWQLTHIPGETVGQEALW